VLLAVIAALGWCCSTLALGPAMQLVDVATASAVRVPLVGALLWVAAKRGNVLPRRSQFGPHAMWAIVGTGVMSVTATAFFLESVALAGAGRAAVLSATSPLFAVPFSIAFLGERGTWRLAAGTLSSVVGVILLAQT
jgi:drug/metabolite transporter (DMT)-like permease